ncbi:MAG: hypothetical protein KJ579_11630 [Verrucomicrobia bacterium]|nr:hypothetical protein [Verrucomicrobiota bacterium]
MNGPRAWLPGLVAAVNGAGFIGYLVWLASRGRRLFFEPQGVIYLLPCIAFFFVFVCLATRKPPAPSATSEPNLQGRTSPPP